MSIRTLLLTVMLSHLSVINAADRVGASPRTPRLVLKNVELDAAGRLHLQLIDEAGLPRSNAGIQGQCGQRAFTGVTNPEGRVATTSLRGGVCQMLVGEQVFACRLWHHGTAPPKSLKSLALVDSNASVIRGNRSKRNRNCPNNGCDPCEESRGLSSEAKHGLAILALGGTAAYFALSRDNASE